MTIAMAKLGLTVMALAQLAGVAYGRLDRLLQGETKTVFEEEIGRIAHVLSMSAPDVRSALEEAAAAYRARAAAE